MKNNIYISDDKTTLGYVDQKGIHINMTGRPVDRTELHKTNWCCSKCGKIFENMTFVELPKPCECGSIFFEGSAK